MSDKTMLEIIKAKNDKNVFEYRKAVEEYKKALEAGAGNLEIPVVSATVGGIEFKELGVVDIPFTTTNHKTLTTKLPCPTEEEVSVMVDAIKKGAAIQDFSATYNMNKINTAIFEKFMNIAPPPVTIIDIVKVTEEGILQQCVKNYNEAGEASKLPRPVSPKQVAKLHK